MEKEDLLELILNELKKIVEYIDYKKKEELYKRKVDNYSPVPRYREYFPENVLFDYEKEQKEEEERERFLNEKNESEWLDKIFDTTSSLDK